MNHRSIYAIIIAAFFIITCAIHFFGPYNIFSAISAGNLARNDEIKEQLDGELQAIEYIGQHTYYIRTSQNDYIMIENRNDDVIWKYKVFEYKKEIEVFKNPM
ncbi:hypothetical protein ABET51_09430 [Metabacillus fastidiosus]|uniref:hypothetical protein n=1 Tax=Metabacillus fastidiosus TaxID=1458 RepID=UPI003D2DC70F